MNSLSKFSLMMAFTTVLFCLLMLSKGFAAPNVRQEQYFFVGQDQGGRLILNLEIEQKIGAGVNSIVRIFSERDGWVQIKQSSGSSFVDQWASGKGAGMQWTDEKQDLFIEMNAVDASTDEGNDQMAVGKGKIQWKGRTLPGTILLRKNKSASQGALMPKPNHVGDWREQIALNLAGEGTLFLYRHSNRGIEADSSNSSPLLGGYICHDSATGRGEKVVISTVAWKRMGTAVLPYAWQGRFEINGKPVVFRIQGERAESSHLFIKGRRQSVARGFVKIGNRNLPVFGMATTEHFLSSEKKIRAFDQAMQQPASSKGMSWEAAKKR